MRITAKDSIVIAIDFQEKLLPAMFNKDELIKNTSILIQGCTELDIPIIFTEQYPKGLGETIPEIKSLVKDSFFFEKTVFSAYKDEKFYNAVNSMGRKNVILCGIEAHICVLQTLIDLQADGYQTILLEDCITSRKIQNEEIAVKRAISEGSLISSYESILFELTNQAGTPVFKKISALIK